MKVYFLPYFEALWPLVLEENHGEWLEFFKKIEQKISRDLDFLSIDKIVQVMASDVVDVSKRRYLLSFLKRRKYTDLQGVSEAWEHFVRLKLNMPLVRVYSAYDLSELTKDLLLKRLRQKWGNIDVRWFIDEKLYGGVKCYMNDLCWDLSICSHVEAFKQAFGIRGIL